MESTNPAIAYPENGFPFFERTARTSPPIPKAKPIINPTGKQQQLTKRETIPKTMEVTAILLAGCFGGGEAGCGCPPGCP